MFLLDVTGLGATRFCASHPAYAVAALPLHDDDVPLPDDAIELNSGTGRLLAAEVLNLPALLQQ